MTNTLYMYDDVICHITWYLKIEKNTLNTKELSRLRRRTLRWSYSKILQFCA